MKNILISIIRFYKFITKHKFKYVNKKTMVSKEEKLEVKHFIELVLINSINIVVEANPYLAFALVTQGIEILGAMNEPLITGITNEYDTKYLSRERFISGLNNINNSSTYLKYCPTKSNKDEYDLYDNLRCGFAHQLRPLGKVSLTHRKEMILEGNTHMQLTSNNKLIIDINSLYEDFKYGCQKTIEKIENGTITHPKAYQKFLRIDVHE